MDGGLQVTGNIFEKRMLGYYPQEVSSIKEIQAIIHAEYPEFYLLSIGIESITQEAYLSTMSEDRIKQWENLLGIIPDEEATIEDRRAVIISRLILKEKLNTAAIESIVDILTGGTVVSWIEDSTLKLDITIPSGGKAYQLEAVAEELQRRIPAHLGLGYTLTYICEESKEILCAGGMFASIMDTTLPQL